MRRTTSMNETGVELFKMISSSNEHFLLTDRGTLVKEGLRRLHLPVPLHSEQAIKQEI